MEKASNMSNHKLLINKLKSYTYAEPLSSWYHLIISERTQIIKYGNHFSNQI